MQWAAETIKGQGGWTQVAAESCPAVDIAEQEKQPTLHLYTDSRMLCGDG